MIQKKYQIIIHNGTAQYFTDETTLRAFDESIVGTRMQRGFDTPEAAAQYMEEQFPQLKLTEGKAPKIKAKKPATPKKKKASKKAKKVDHSEIDLKISKVYTAASELWKEVPKGVKEIVNWRQKMKLNNQKLAELFMKRSLEK